MNLNDYYLHATGGYLGMDNEDNIIIEILKSGKILTPESRNQRSLTLSYDNEICLCDPRKNTEKIEYSSFVLYPMCGPTLVLDREIEVYTPDFNADYTKGSTDLYDEVRCKGDISLSHLKFITFPIFDSLTKTPKKNTAISSPAKLEYLNIFEENIKIIENDFSFVPVKDIYTGKTITAGEVRQKLKTLMHDFIKDPT